VLVTFEKPVFYISAIPTEQRPRILSHPDIPDLAEADLQLSFLPYPYCSILSTLCSRPSEQTLLFVES